MSLMCALAVLSQYPIIIIPCALKEGAGLTSSNVNGLERGSQRHVCNILVLSNIFIIDFNEGYNLVLKYSCKRRWPCKHSRMEC